MLENQKNSYPVFEMMSRADSVAPAKPASINRKNKRLSFASLRQILTRITKSFLLNASSASIQLGRD